MMSCSICHKATLEEQLTEIGLGSNVYQCEECWNTTGGEPLNFCWWCEKHTARKVCTCPECLDEPENNRGEMCKECEIEQ